MTLPRGRSAPLDDYTVGEIESTVDGVTVERPNTLLATRPVAAEHGESAL